MTLRSLASLAKRSPSGFNWAHTAPPMPSSRSPSPPVAAGAGTARQRRGQQIVELGGQRRAAREGGPGHQAHAGSGHQCAHRDQDHGAATLWPRSRNGVGAPMRSMRDSSTRPAANAPPANSITT